MIWRSVHGVCTLYCGFLVLSDSGPSGMANEMNRCRGLSFCTTEQLTVAMALARPSPNRSFEVGGICGLVRPCLPCNLPSRSHALCPLLNSSSIGPGLSEFGRSDVSFNFLRHSLCLTLGLQAESAESVGKRKSQPKQIDVVDRQETARSTRAQGRLSRRFTWNPCALHHWHGAQPRPEAPHTMPSAVAKATCMLYQGWAACRFKGGNHRTVASGVRYRLWRFAHVDVRLFTGIGTLAK
ncbi:unnamed protein product [Sphagnum jensenii]